MQPAIVENVAGQRMLRLTEAQAFRLRTFPLWTLIHENAKVFGGSLALVALMAPFGIARYKLAVADAHFNRGLELYYQGRNDEAVWQYQQSLQVLPGYSGSYNNIGLCLENEGHYAQAISLYRQALALDPNSSHAHSDLGKMLFFQGRRVAGLAEIRAAVRANPNDARSHTMLGNVLYRSGNKSQAREEWRMALHLGDQVAAQHLRASGGL